MRRIYSIFLIVMMVVVGTVILCQGCIAAGWHHYTTADGLMDDWVQCLYESNDGSIWIGMYIQALYPLGLNQYTEGKVLSWESGFGPQNTFGICQDQQGAILATGYGGCWLLEDGMWRKEFPSRYDFGLSESGIVRAPDCRFWLAFINSVYCYDPVSEVLQFVWEPTPYHNAVRHLFMSSDGHMWCCNMVSPTDQPRCIYEINDSGEVLSSFPNHYGDIAQAPDGTMWFGRTDETDPLYVTSGIERLDGDEIVYAGPPGGYPARAHGPIFISDNGELACAGEYDGEAHGSSKAILTFDGENWTHYPCPFQLQIEDLLIDSRGDIWLAVPGYYRLDDGLWVLRRDMPAILLALDVEPSYISGPTYQRVLLDLQCGAEQTVDFFAAVQLPSGELLFYPAFGLEMTPFLPGVHVPADTDVEGYELFSIALPDLPAGAYRWFAACTHAGTMDFASNIASCEWEFVN